MTNTLLDAALHLSLSFETRERANGDKFVCLVNAAPQWMLDAVQAAHGDAFPDDAKYTMIERVADSIAEFLSENTDADSEALDEVRFEKIDNLIPIYNRDRLDWLASSLTRADYCDMAQEEGLLSEGSTMFDRIAAGIAAEYGEIWDAIAAALLEQADDEDTDEEGEG
jgi:hypothetical protein